MRHERLLRNGQAGLRDGNQPASDEKPVLVELARFALTGDIPDLQNTGHQHTLHRGTHPPVIQRPASVAAVSTW